LTIPSHLNLSQHVIVEAESLSACYITSSMEIFFSCTGKFV